VRPVVVYASTLASLAWLLAPFLWLVRSSISPTAELTQKPPVWLPRELTLAHYQEILQAFFVRTTGFSIPELIVTGLRNSLLVSLAVMLISLVVGGLAAYAFSRLRFPLRNTLLLGLLASRMVPAFAIIIPFFVLFRHLQLYNTLHGLVLAELSGTLPFTVWILKNYLDTITVELEEAALVDGASRLQAIWHVTMPVAGPGLVAAGLFAFMLAWNSFLFPLILASSPAVMTVQPQIAAAYGEHRAEYGLLFAGSVLAALPPVLIALALQRYMMQGLLSGAVKG
jgi:multiple sugar transport system permease protein